MVQTQCRCRLSVVAHAATPPPAPGAVPPRRSNRRQRGNARGQTPVHLHSSTGERLSSPAGSQTRHARPPRADTVHAAARPPTESNLLVHGPVKRSARGPTEIRAVNRRTHEIATSLVHESLKDVTSSYRQTYSSPKTMPFERVTVVTSYYKELSLSVTDRPTKFSGDTRTAVKAALAER